MTANDRGEYSTPREDKRLLPDGRPRRANQQERAREIRSARVSGVALPCDIEPGTKVSD